MTYYASIIFYDLNGYFYVVYWYKLYIEMIF